MTTTLATAARNAACDAVVDLVDGGAGAGILRIRASTTTLVDITLSDPAFGAASTGVATAAGLPLVGTVATSGTADNFQVLDSTAAVIWSGSVTVTGGGGDCTLTSVTLVATDTVTIDTFTHTQPA